MSAVDFPDLVPAEIEFGLRHNVQVSTSDLSGYVQTVELPGARWVMTVTMPTLERANSQKFEAFIAKLRGGAVRASLPVFRRSAPLGSWAGAPAVENEIGSPSLVQNGNTLEVKNATAYATFNAGDYFNLGAGGQLLMVTEDAVADSGGRVQLAVAPSIRSAPATGVLLVSANPKIPLAMLTEPEQRWRVMPADLYEHALQFVEVFA